MPVYTGQTDAIPYFTERLATLISNDSMILFPFILMLLLALTYSTVQNVQVGKMFEGFCITQGAFI